MAKKKSATQRTKKVVSKQRTIQRKVDAKASKQAKPERKPTQAGVRSQAI